MEIINSVEEYLHYLKSVRRYSPSTLESLGLALKFFLRFCELRRYENLTDLGRAELTRFEKYLYIYKRRNGEHLGFSSQAQRISAVRGFFRYLVRTNRILYNPASHLELPREGKRLPRFVLTAKETEKILSLPGKSKTGIRDRAILEMFYSTGIRRGELIRLQLHDVNFAGESLFVQRGKGGKDRIVPVGRRALNYLEKYLRVRPQFLTNVSDNTLFLDEAGHAFDKSVLGWRVASYIIRARIGKHGSCHLFRHTMATLMLENGASVRYVQQMLGHSRVETTQTYTHVSMQKLREIHQRFHPASVAAPAEVQSVVRKGNRKKGVYRPKSYAEEIIILSPEELEAIAETPDIKTPEGLRDRAMLEILLSSGVDRCELVELRVVDVEGHLLRIQRRTMATIAAAKKFATCPTIKRDIPITYRAHFWLKKYLAEGRKHFVRHRETTALFMSNVGVKLDRQNFPRTMNRSARRGVGKCVSSLSWRESWRKMMRDTGADAAFTEAMLGIKTDINPQALRRTLNECHPYAMTGKISEEKKEESAFDEAMADFLAHLQRKNYSHHTVKGMKSVLPCFIRWAEKRDIRTPQAVTQADVLSYQKALYEEKNTRTGKPLTAHSCKGRLLAVVSFFAYLTKENRILYNPAADIELPKVSKNLRADVLTVEETLKIIEAPQTTSALGLRDRAMLELLYATGIRREELCRLTLQNVRLGEAVIFIEQGKGNRDRYLPLGERAVFWMTRYLKESRPLLTKGYEHKFFFAGSFSLPLGPIALGQIVARYVKASGVKKRGSSLLFRHAMATHLLEGGADLRHIQEMLGHASVETTEIYTHASLGKLREVHRKTHPAARTQNP